MIESTWRVRGWVQVAMAALAMVATLPGRTFGLGLITEPLIADVGLDRDQFATVNVWATLIGALFCLPAGQLLDRFGSRVLLTTIYLALGATVCLLAGVTAFLPLAVFITLTRGLGQSALSVVSISMIGRWFDRRLALATAIYSGIMSLGFFAAMIALSLSLQSYGWRDSWRGLGFTLLALAPLNWLLVRHRPESASSKSEMQDLTGGEPIAQSGLSLSAALATPAFWAFALATSLFGLIATGFALFNQQILAERGFDVNTYYTAAMSGPFIGLVGQGLCAWAVRRWSYQHVIAAALTLYAVALLGYTQIVTRGQLAACVVLLGVAGGMITVIFFAIWAHAFGRRHLGRIQGAAQMATVFASAIGPKIFTTCELRYGTLYSALYGLAPVVLVLAVLAAITKLPQEKTAAETTVTT